MPMTTKQMEYLALAWQCFETEPKIDHTKFAQVAGLKNARSAAELMRVAKNKLKAEYGSMSTGMQTANTPTRNAAKPVTGKKRARKAAGEAGEGSEGHADRGGDEDDEEGSPRKKVKGSAVEEGKGVKAEVAVGSGEEDLDLGFQ
ncbi:hypothetical protein LTR35_000414 [Friedmanniomyces endolithicus]|uniref:Uncharacterized protein n=1 Tax=Friedmanniomyces endolithicus TaxID=329885 RepID=A0AAN6JH78_9PEZI|nr:hypothetical protein LTS00_009256 [Friedmanniomyces endolithicus]KAK0293807.1 hypothetical protein LTR35_000414 [Friedmanniomyces endolithicus]KAK0324322.1 hypothetical protein LTR82_004761 [Friedmanniomyces endolithicus]KAK0972518.1 hypothetical protein LTR54_017550 [Friedmanniomyces endolithicus]